MPASPARGLRSGELQNHDHKDDDDQHTDDRADNSPVHGEPPLVHVDVPAYRGGKHTTM